MAKFLTDRDIQYLDGVANRFAANEIDRQEAQALIDAGTPRDFKMDFSKYLFRCSSLSRIMAGATKKGITKAQMEEIATLEARDAEFKATGNKKKALTDNMKQKLADLISRRDDDSPPELTSGVKKYLRQLWIEATKGRKKEIRSKYLEKGLAVEEDAITLVSMVDKTLYYKNEEHLSNDYIKGTPDWGVDETDIHKATVIDDGKCSWDIFTFYDAKDEPLNTVYEWQLQGYMFLLPNVQEARLRYCLIDTPDPLVEKEKKSMYFELGVLDPDGPNPESVAYLEACEAIDRAAKYGDIPDEERVITKVIKRDPAMHELIVSQVALCRQYLQTLS